MRVKLSMREALSHPDVFGPIMQGESWFGHKVLLIAAAGETLTDDEREVFRKLTNREREPGKMCRELVAIFGRRAGKTMMLAVFVCWLAALVDHSDVLGLAAGVALIISRDQRASLVMLDYVEKILSSSLFLAQLIVSRTADSIFLSNNVSIEVRPCNRISSRGITAISICADEIGHWFTSADFANPDSEVLGAARPALLTTLGPVLMASSVYAKRGVLFDSFKKYYGPDGPPDTIIAYGGSRDLNPSIPQEEIDRELEKKPVRNRAEYLSEWRSDVEGFISREVVESCVDNYHELPAQPNINSQCGIDQASGVTEGDSFAIVIAHKLGDRAIIDAIREIRPPFNFFELVETVLLPLCKSYRIYKVVGDNYGALLAQDPIRRAGIGFELAEKHKSALYVDPFLPLLNAKKILMPKHERAINQICSLERSLLRTGREQITHPIHGHDDIANAIALAVDLVYSRVGYDPGYRAWDPNHQDEDVAPTPPEQQSSANTQLLNFYKALAGAPSKPAEPIQWRPRPNKPIWPW
jgi:hypothetical protein